MNGDHSAAPARVLHVVDRLTGGVPLAVASYIDNSPPAFQHVIVAPTGQRVPEWDERGLQVLDLGESHVGRVRTLRRAVRGFDPHTIHAHSSFAGGYARLAARRGARRIVYTPHCFAFAREDRGRLWRRLFRVLEGTLGFNTSLVAACSESEAALASDLTSVRGRIIPVPNVARMPSVARRPTSLGGALRVGMVGRIGPQKDPAYFAGVVSRLRRAGLLVDAVWIGGGDAALVAELADADIRVTGWVRGAHLEAALDTLDVYVHSARWEGFPLSLLDAHARGVPLLVRETATSGEIPAPHSADDGITGLIAAAGDDDDFARWVALNRDYWSSRLRANDAAHQTAALARVWSHGPDDQRSAEPSMRRTQGVRS